MRTNAVALSIALLGLGASAGAYDCPNDPRCAASPYGIVNPYGPNAGPYYYPNYDKRGKPIGRNAPKLYDWNGRYRGNINPNPADPDSIYNPVGRYGSPYSPDSVDNPYLPPPVYIEPGRRGR